MKIDNVRFCAIDISDEWIQTRGGKQFFPRDPDPDAIEREEIAKVLSRICRFGGHTRDFYSVAQHSVLVREILRHEPIEIQLAGLLHDAEEAYSGFGDLLGPIRHLAGVYGREIKPRIEGAVGMRFLLDARYFDDPRIKRADLIALATEKRDIMGPAPAPWKPLPPPLPFQIHAWRMETAERMFLAYLNSLANRWIGGIMRDVEATRSEGDEL